jgi:hypothetical protein
MNCAYRDEEQRRGVSLEDLLQSGRTSLAHNSCGRHGRRYTALDLNPVPLDELRIFDGHHVCFLLQLFVSGRGHDERAHST